MTPEQEQLWADLAYGETPEPSGDQEPIHAANSAVTSFRHTCQFEGLPVPSEAEVQEYAPWWPVPSV